MQVSPKSFIIPVLIPVLFGLIMLSYLNSLHSPTILDDRFSFIDNNILFLENSFSFETLQKLISSRFGWARVLPMATFSADYAMGHGDIVQFHITNILIHLLATFACFSFLHLLWKQKQSLPQENLCKRNLLIVFFAVSVWSLNPIQTNAVIYIVQRMTSLAAFFYLSSLSGYIIARTSSQQFRKYIAWLFFVCMGCGAFLSKENSATLPLTILLVEEFFIQPGLTARVLRSRLIIRLFPGLLLLVVLLLPIGLVYWNKLIASGYDIRHFTLLQRLMTEARVVVFYMGLFLFPLPSRMNLDHDFPISYSLINPLSTFFCLLLIVVLFLGAFRVRKTHRLISFGILWFFLHLVIESTIIPLELVFEHRLYLPSIGVVIVLASVLQTFVEKVEMIDHRRFLFLLTLIISSLLSLLTTIRNYDWRDTLSLYKDCVQKSPMKARTHSNYAMALGKEGRFREALQEGEKTIALGKDYYEEDISALANIVVGYSSLGEHEKGIARAEEYLKKNDLAEKKLNSFPRLMTNLGVAYFKTNEYQKSFISFLTGIHFAPYDQTLHVALKLLYEFATGNDEAAKALKISGDKSEQFISLAQIVMDVRRYDLAEEYLLQAEKNGALESDLLDARELLYGNVNKNNEAIRSQRLRYEAVLHGSYKNRLIFNSIRFVQQYYPPLQGKGVRLMLDQLDNKDKRNPHFQLLHAVSYEASGEYQLAMLELKKLTSSYEGFSAAYYEQGKLAKKLGQHELAINSFKHLLKVFPGHPEWYMIEQLISKES